MKTTKELIIADITAKVEAKLASQKVELSSVDKFRSEYSKIKTANTTLYLNKIEQIRKEVQKGIEDVGNFEDRIKKILSGLRELGLNDEIKPFEVFMNDVQNDFKELVFINDRLK
jgi:phage-related protein